MSFRKCFYSNYMACLSMVLISLLQAICLRNFNLYWEATGSSKQTALRKMKKIGVCKVSGCLNLPEHVTRL
jgi:hypothetical protein